MRIPNVTYWKFLSPLPLPQCMECILQEPQQFDDEFYRAEKMEGNAIYLTFLGVKGDVVRHTEYTVQFAEHPEGTILDVEFEHEFFGLPPLTSPATLCDFFQQKAKANRAFGK